MAYVYSGRLVRVIDGDTVDVIVDLGFKTFKQVRVRLVGVDTPEVYGVRRESDEYARGMEAKAMVDAWFARARLDLEIQTFRDRTGKYGRYLAKISAELDDGSRSCINDVLRDAGHGDQDATA